MAYGLTGKMLAVAGKGDELEGYLLTAAAGMAEVEGCWLYLVSRIDGEPDAVMVTEVWDSSASHQASLQIPGTAELIARVRPIIAGMSDRIEFLPKGGKGISRLP